MSFWVEFAANDWVTAKEKEVGLVKSKTAARTLGAWLVGKFSPSIASGYTGIVA
jgi:hypothetical protein